MGREEGGRGEGGEGRRGGEEWDGGHVQVLSSRLGYAQGLTVSLLAWPSLWVILIGALLSTIGAGLQSLTG